MARRLRNLRSFARRDSNYRATNRARWTGNAKQTLSSRFVSPDTRALVTLSWYLTHLALRGSLLSPGEQITIISDVSKMELSSRIVVICSWLCSCVSRILNATFTRARFLVLIPGLIFQHLIPLSIFREWSNHNWGIFSRKKMYMWEILII